MPISLIVVDDFLERATELRDAGLRLTYPDQEGAFPGRNRCSASTAAWCTRWFSRAA